MADRPGTELMAQQESTGILYQGYDRDFHLCIYEESSVQGRNERYEFRCDTSLECCGRVCCIPVAAGIPLWLWLLFLILGLLLLLALLSLLWYLCARRKRKQKKEITGYRSIKQSDDDAHQRGYRFGDVPRRSSFHEEEIFEESFKEEIEYGDNSSLGSVDEVVERVDRHERRSNSRDYGNREFGTAERR